MLFYLLHKFIWLYVDYICINLVEETKVPDILFLETITQKNLF